MPVFQLDSLHLILLFPFLGFLVNGIFGKFLGRRFVNFVAVSAMVLSAWQSTLTVFQLWRVGSRDGHWVGARLVQNLYNWFTAGSFSVDVTLMVDPLTAVMIMVVTWVGLLIHIYSTGYMEHDDGFWRYFAYLNLFIFSMLILVMGKSLVLMFVGWEGVGLCSYLLIGFWFEDAAKAAAGLKAFVVNRVGDFGFILGMFTLVVLFGTLDSVELEQKVAALKSLDTLLPMGGPLAGMAVGTAITMAVLLMFVGATGKSAQIPLYIWLPDAMAGPTPVSALIHAATMVTAGVYMLSRVNFLVVLSPTAMLVIALVGGCTALFAATIGFAQTDIKKVLAYSTVSQLGYMFLGAGVGAFVASIFHLVTHAFFKACLFLGSGSVIHGMGGEQDIRKMGGLRKYMPRTRDTFLMATLAIMGFPLTAGFMSKDEILWWAYASPAVGSWNVVLWLMGFIGAGCTSFYMWRCYFMTFSGDGRRIDHHAKEHVHESPSAMTAPLWILGVLSLVGGFFGVPALLGEPVAKMLGQHGNAYHGNFILNWLEPVYAVGSTHPLARSMFAGPGELAARAGAGHTMEWVLMIASVLVGLGGWWLASRMYFPEPSPALANIPKGGLAFIYRGALNKWWIDELYNAVIIQPVKWVSDRVLRAIDAFVVDGLLTVVPPAVVKLTGSVVARVQNGDMQRYVALIVLGVCLALMYVVR
ncbi:MAG: NADH-quinone oxidoreductase subunit L [Deltaproteobacteria bacterium]|nr:NADH-quinone oxidoreductase subunit L [Deltaproteobacteria bacterium]